MPTRPSTVSPSVSISSGHEGRPLGTRRGGHRNQLQFGIDRFGRLVAERTFARVHRFLFQFLPASPYTGKYLDDRDIYEVWIVKTPFVIFYRVDAELHTITVLALFHHAQDRYQFDPEE